MGNATKKLGKFATLNDKYLRVPITQPDVQAEQYEIKPTLLNLVQQNQFGHTHMSSTYILFRCRHGDRGSVAHSMSYHIPI